MCRCKDFTNARATRVIQYGIEACSYCAAETQLLYRMHAEINLIKYILKSFNKFNSKNLDGWIGTQQQFLIYFLFFKLKWFELVPRSQDTAF